MIKITFNVNSALLNNYVAHIFRNLAGLDFASKKQKT